MLMWSHERSWRDLVRPPRRASLSSPHALRRRTVGVHEAAEAHQGRGRDEAAPLMVLCKPGICSAVSRSCGATRRSLPCFVDVGRQVGGTFMSSVSFPSSMPNTRSMSSRSSRNA
jgi:hypothetical protein